MSSVEFEPRKTCPRCRRPEAACYCASVVEMPTRTRVVVLQHPREADVAINTARIAALCLPSSSVHVGVDFSNDRELLPRLSDPAYPPILLWPGEGARDLAAEPPPSPVTLVVVDGTWWQARKLVRSNPLLEALPRYAFTPPRPGDYRIRREPAEHCVSTIEAMSYALGFLENRSFEPMLAPFRAMVDYQIDCRDRIGASRQARRSPDKPVGLSSVLHDNRDRLVVVVAEANGYPYDAPVRHPEELVHLVAVRLSTGEVLDELAAPVAPLYPSTPLHLAVPEAAILSAPPLDALRLRWQAFLRPDDVICTWGTHASRLASAAFGAPLRPLVDLRAVAGNLCQGAPGSMDSFASWLAVAPSPPPARGRAGQRAAVIEAILRGMLARPVLLVWILHRLRRPCGVKAQAVTGRRRAPCRSRPASRTCPCTRCPRTRSR